MPTKSIVAVAIGLVLAAGAANAVPVSPNLVVNGGFETGSFSGWTQSGQTDHTYIEPTTNFAAHGGTYSAMLGPVGGDGTLSQALTTVAGAAYTVSFWFQDPSSDTTPDFFAVTWNAQTLTSATNFAGPLGWTDEVFNVYGTGSDTLKFTFRDDPAYLGLDDVSVTGVPAAVPEPATLGLIGAGLLAFGIRRRKGR